MYLVGLEIVLRMTGAGLLWEFGKLGAIILLILGMGMDNLKQHKISVLILIYISSFIPSIFLVPIENFDLWRQSVSFNLSGPISLFISFLYFRNRLINRIELARMFKMILLPLLSMSIILIVRAPDAENIIFSSEANYQMSGGYGPNQVSSALGLVIAIIALSKILGFFSFFPISDRLDNLQLAGRPNWKFREKK